MKIFFYHFSRVFLSSCRPRQSSRPLDRSCQRTEKEEALFQIPNIRAGKRIPFQCLCVEAKALGTGAKPQPDGAPNQNLVPKSTYEVEERTQNGKHERYAYASNASSTGLSTPSPFTSDGYASVWTS